ncbi:hypothetical protein Rhopal_001357-T1 [Rhodotorula paludigena]|uniref:FAR1 domain-containing protein n=1 Tax=Rhodotorula paludigena TaxID=86838 RepID=A0AAV5GFI8_9BASI|nr:hypothetical protein Rhopal_001357-T1 [Rhodotorula paludigena]
MTSPAPSTSVDAHPPALAADAPTYPPLGAHFPSVAHFKLACYRVCLLDGTHPADHAGAATHAHVSCRHAPCTFRIAASNASRGWAPARTRAERGTGPGDVWVSERTVGHSCGARGRDGDDGAAETRRKIERMEQAVREAEREWERREELRDEWEREDERRRAERDERGRAAAKKARKGIRESLAGLGGASRRPRRAEEEDGEDEAENSEDERVSKEEEALSGVELFPPKAHVKSHVDRLIKAGEVAFPASSESFNSAAPLFVRLYAYAQHSGFGLYRGSDHTQTTSARLVCSRSHSRYSSQPGGCCSASVKIGQDTDGTWRVIEARLQHNHPLDPDSSSASAHLWSVPLYPPCAPPSAHLQAFLRVTLPPDLPLSDVYYFAAFLASLGIDSANDLVGLVSLCDTALAALDEMATLAFGAREWSMSQLLVMPFPEVGDIFDSLDDFKRVVYRFAASREIRLGPTGVKDGRTYWRCMLPDKSWNGPAERRCTYTIATSWADARKKSVKIHRVELSHSCDPAQRKKQAAAAEEAMLDRLDKLETRESESDDDSGVDKADTQPVAGSRFSLRRRTLRADRCDHQSERRDTLLVPVVHRPPNQSKALFEMDACTRARSLWSVPFFPPSAPPSVLLQAFLRATLPPDLPLSDYDYVAIFLASLGIDSDKDLVGLVSLCDTALAALDEMATLAFGTREWSMGQLVALVKAE